MNKLYPWNERSIEEASLFNPAFTGSLIFEFIKEFQDAKHTAVPFILPFCSIPIALHPATRRRLPSSTLTSLYDWINKNQDLTINYNRRASNLVPYIQEAVKFLLSRSIIVVNEIGEIQTSIYKVAYTPKVLSEYSPDIQEAVKASRMLGRWFAKAGSTSSILAVWGIKP